MFTTHTNVPRAAHLRRPVPTAALIAALVAISACGSDANDGMVQEITVVE